MEPDLQQVWSIIIVGQKKIELLYSTKFEVRIWPLTFDLLTQKSIEVLLRS